MDEQRTALLTMMVPRDDKAVAEEERVKAVEATRHLESPPCSFFYFQVIKK
jgi:hypothetical protein